MALNDYILIYHGTIFFFVCVCVHMFLYPSGDLNLNAHRLTAPRVTVGTQAYKSVSNK